MKPAGLLAAHPWTLSLTGVFVAAVLATVVSSAAPLSPQAGGQPASRPEPILPIPSPDLSDKARIAIGEALFADPRLSHGNRRACSSCHDTSSNGADARRSDLTPDGAPIPINTNTVFDAALSFRLDWLGDARTLEEQAEMSLQSPSLMATSFGEVIEKLGSDPLLSGRFRAVYGHGPDRASLLDAIAAYERTLLTPDSRFDRWLRGDDKAISSDELAGYRLFKSAGCVACHQGVNVGGNLFERNGIFEDLTEGGTRLMRVPSLRNVAVTPPYFHDGSSPTLGGAVQKMASAQLGRNLTPSQVGLIVAFLESLTGEYEGRPLSEPAR